MGGNDLDVALADAAKGAPEAVLGRCSDPPAPALQELGGLGVEVELLAILVAWAVAYLLLVDTVERSFYARWEQAAPPAHPPAGGAVPRVAHLI